MLAVAIVVATGGMSGNVKSTGTLSDPLTPFFPRGKIRLFPPSFTSVGQSIKEPGLETAEFYNKLILPYSCRYCHKLFKMENDGPCVLSTQRKVSRSWSPLG